MGQINVTGQGQTNKEALFNEVKGSLFEYLLARKLSALAGQELAFQQSLDRNYLTVLGQQDRMVRQFYPEMLPFLNHVSDITLRAILDYLKVVPTEVRLMGKFSNSQLEEEVHEADLLLSTSQGRIFLSLKLNKKNAFVNTKSGGIKSFFSLYFSFLPSEVQQDFNQFVDMEFVRMSHELHQLNDLEFQGNYHQWIKSGLSELPGELNQASRDVLKSYYARIASRMHLILKEAHRIDPEGFCRGLAPLMGFGRPDILQVVCFHDFKAGHDPEVQIHPFEEVSENLKGAVIEDFNYTSSVEVSVGHWRLMIRVKPMNKFTTTAIKINCSVRVGERP